MRFAADCCWRFWSSASCCRGASSPSLPLSVVGYWLRTMELEGFVAGLVLPALECMGMDMGIGLGPPTWVCISHSQRDRQSCFAGCSCSSPRASTYQVLGASTGRPQLEHCSLQAVSSRLTSSCDLRAASCELQAALTTSTAGSRQHPCLRRTHSSLLGFRRLDLVLVDVGCLPACLPGRGRICWSGQAVASLSV